jgi:hypothetical protein
MKNQYVAKAVASRRAVAVWAEAVALAVSVTSVNHAISFIIEISTRNAL